MRPTTLLVSLATLVLTASVATAGTSSATELAAVSLPVQAQDRCTDYTPFKTYAATPLDWSWRLCNAGVVSGEDSYEFIFRFRNTSSRRFEFSYLVYMEQPERCDQRTGAIASGTWQALPAGATTGGWASGNAFTVPTRRYAGQIFLCVTRMAYGSLGGVEEVIIADANDRARADRQRADAARQQQQDADTRRAETARVEAERQRQADAVRQAEAERREETARQSRAAQQTQVDRQRAELEREKQEILREAEASRQRAAQRNSAMDSLAALANRIVEERAERRRQERLKRIEAELERTALQREQAVENTRSESASSPRPEPSVTPTRSRTESVQQLAKMVEALGLEDIGVRTGTNTRWILYGQPSYFSFRVSSVGVSDCSVRFTHHRRYREGGTESSGQTSIDLKSVSGPFQIWTLTDHNRRISSTNYSAHDDVWVIKEIGLLYFSTRDEADAFARQVQEASAACRATPSTSSTSGPQPGVDRSVLDARVQEA